MTSHTCIWCLGECHGDHLEHIVPEAMGCPPGFTLNSETICQRCNSGMGHLDQAVAHDFDFLSFWAQVPRKGGKSPELSSRGNVFGFKGADGPEIHFNMNREATITRGGRRIAGYRGSKRDVKAGLERKGQKAEITFKISLGESQKFRRGVYKIAVSALVYFIGAAEFIESKYNGVREFVRFGKGQRHLIVLGGSHQKKYSHRFSPPYATPDGDFVVGFTLASVDFIVDLSESERHLDKIVNEASAMYGDSGWACIPIR